MRHRTLVPSAPTLVSLLITLAFIAPHAFAADDRRDDEYGYQETARVVRVSLIAGEVSLRRSGGNRWERATLNMPLAEGDRLATGPGARVEIQIDARNFVRVGEYATLDIITLRDEGIALSLPEGTATLSLARFEREREYFEIDAPGMTIAAQARGLYRLDVDAQGRVRVTVRDGGRARLYSESSGFTLRDGRTAEMVARGDANDSDWEFSDVRPFDAWDAWVDERERFLLARLRHDDRSRYYDEQVWGAEELDLYGDWVSTHDYGYVWRPRTIVINNYYNWAPYRYGRWTWCPPYGWTWVADEPWGWAPYHYGRWVYVDNYWCWAPRGYYGYHHRSWWRPALVAFVSIHLSFGDHICWYPLPYHHPDPQSNFWRSATRERLSPLGRDELANLQRVNPIYQRAVTSLPAREFAAGARAAQPPNTEIARRAITTEPVRGRLPLRPAEGDPNADAPLRERLSESKRAGLAARPVDGVPASGPLRTLPERATGAASRKAGIALDDELRRERIFNNRTPIPSKDGVKEIGDGETRRTDDGRPTGAVARPARPIRLPEAGAEKTEVDSWRTNRPARPVVSSDEGGRKRDPLSGEMPERRVRPTGGSERSDSEGVRKVTPPEYRRERPEPRDGEPVHKEKPERRESRPAPPEPSERERPDFSPSPSERRPPPVEQRESPRYERPEPRREERPSPPREEQRPSPPPREERHEPPPAPREEKHAPPREERHAEPARETPARPARERPPDNN